LDFICFKTDRRRPEGSASAPVAVETLFVATEDLDVDALLVALRVLPLLLAHRHLVHPGVLQNPIALLAENFLFLNFQKSSFFFEEKTPSKLKLSSEFDLLLSARKVFRRSIPSSYLSAKIANFEGSFNANTSKGFLNHPQIFKFFSRQILKSLKNVLLSQSPLKLTNVCMSASAMGISRMSLRSVSTSSQ